MRRLGPFPAYSQFFPQLATKESQTGCTTNSVSLEVFHVKKSDNLKNIKALNITRKFMTF